MSVQFKKTAVLFFAMTASILPFQNCTKMQSSVNSKSYSNSSLGGAVTPPNSGGVTPPNGGGGDVTPTAKIKVPVGVIRWDAFNRTSYNKNDDSTYSDVSPEERASLSPEEFIDQIPYHSKIIPWNTIEKNKWENNGWGFMNTRNRVEFYGDTPETMNQDNIYAKQAGIDYWLFLYYATNETAIARSRMAYEKLADKNGIKAAFAGENMGYDREGNINHVVDSFDKDWYQKIDGKPIFYLTGSGKYSEDLARDLRSKYGKPIYFVSMNMAGDGSASNEAGPINKNNYQAGTWYATWPTGDRTHSALMQDEFNRLNTYNNSSFDLVPNLTISFYQKARSEFLQSMGLNFGGYSSKATAAEVGMQLEYFKNYIDAHPQKVKTMIAYSWNEHSEGGLTLSPTLNRDLSINTKMVELFGTYCK